MRKGQMYERTYDVNFAKLKPLYSFLLLLPVMITALFWACVSLAQTGESSHAQYTVASVYWNRVARRLVSNDFLDPVSASRTYAYLGIAQNDAAAAAEAAAKETRVPTIRSGINYSCRCD